MIFAFPLSLGGVDVLLKKNTRFILLYDFYQDLLTEKQKQYMTLYFEDDLSLGEIAEEFKISRQAVYEHIKRAATLLEDYEAKLQLLHKYEIRTKTFEEMLQLLEGHVEEECRTLAEKITLLKRLD